MANVGMAGPQPAGGDPQQQGPGLMDVLDQQHQGTSAALEKLNGGQQVLKKARAAMDKLVAMGDNVTADDTIDMGGELVAAGLSASAVAQLFSTMPPGGGEALAGWIQQQDQGLQQREAQMKQAMASTQHHAGVNALRLLAAAHHPDAQPAGAPPAAMGGQNGG